MSENHLDVLIWGVSALAVAGVVIRPFGIGEWIFAVAGAAILALTRLMPLAAVGRGIAAGFDVYLFLIGMMLLAEVARREGLFDYLAARAARAARGSPRRLFALVYLVGTVVTVFLSNDATAVVLTPAVAAVARAARAETPLPYLLICAFVANAASFVLPISNPANLVVFGSAMPPLAAWLGRFSLASLVSILSTYGLLYLKQRKNLAHRLASDVAVQRLGRGGRIAAIGLVLAGAVLVAASALGRPLGPPTAIAGVLTLAGVLITEKRSPWPVLAGIAWDTIVLVAALFVIVEALEGTGLKAVLTDQLEVLVRMAPGAAAFLVGLATALATNLVNNLPLGLVGGGVVAGAHMPDSIADAVLIGIDLGPNLSVTGSLATILWLAALRREGLHFGALAFLRLGALIMLPTLVLALGARFVVP